MNKVILSTLLAGLFVSSTVLADTYIQPTVDFKDKQDSTANHTVYGLTVGQSFENGWKIEGRMEDETVNGGAHEGLAQIGVAKDIGTWYGVTPYAGAAIGLKDKSTSEFVYYRVDIGAKYTVLPGLTVFANERLRTPFNENLDGHTGYGYKTWESKVGVNYNFTKSQSVGASYAVERGDSAYNTVGVNYKYAF